MGTPKHSQKRMTMEEGKVWTSLREVAVKALYEKASIHVQEDAPEGIGHLLKRAIARRVDERYNSADDKRGCIKASSISVTLQELMESVRPAPRQALVAQILDLMIEKGKAVVKYQGAIQKTLTSGTVKDLANLVTTLEAI